MQTEDFKSHTHTQNTHNHPMPHTHNYQWDGRNNGSIGPGGNDARIEVTGTTTGVSTPNTSNTTATNQNTGGTETRPANRTFRIWRRTA